MDGIELLVALHKNRITATIFNILRVTKSLYLLSSIITKTLSTAITAVNMQENVYGKYREKLPRIIIIHGRFCKYLK